MIQIAAAVVVKDGQILIARRTEGIVLAGKWELPGGAVDPDKSMVQSLIINLANSGIEVEVDNFICMNQQSFEFDEIELYAYQVNYISGEYVSEVYDEIKWVLPSELSDYDFHSAYIPVCRRVANELSC